VHTGTWEKVLKFVTTTAHSDASDKRSKTSEHTTRMDTAEESINVKTEVNGGGIIRFRG
jgi:hypothetical protein